MDGFQNEGILREEERSLSIYAKEKESIDRVYDLLPHVALEAHYHVLHFSHYRIEFGSLQVRDIQRLICFLVVLF